VSGVRAPIALTAEAEWLMGEAQALAASIRHETFGTTHVLAVALRSDTTFGAALRAGPAGDQFDAIRDDMAHTGGARRVPVHQVRPDPDVSMLLEASQRQAASEGRSTVDAEDITWTLTAVLGPHSRFFAAGEPAARAALLSDGGRPATTPAWRRFRPVAAAGCAGSLLWALWMTLMKGLNAGVTLLIAGAGVALHHAGVEAIGLVCRFRSRFRGWVDHIGGQPEMSRVLSTRETVAVTLGLRLALAAISITTFAVMVLELKGVGLSPSPAFSRDPIGALGTRSEVDTNLLVLVFGGPRPFELWIAIGTAFVALPPYGEIDRVCRLLETGSRRNRTLALTLRPMRGVMWLFDRFDTFTTPLGLPTMLSSGVVGILVCLLAGGALATLVIAAAA
jgi:hypothetical protein